MKILAIDHGKKRVGVAVSDPTRTHAFPVETVDGGDRHRLIARLQELVEEHQVVEIVVGLPLTMKGEVGHQASKVEKFADRLRHRFGEAVEVTLWDERLSSAQADRGRSGSKKEPPGMRDMMAAVIILQSYLDRKR